MSPGARRVLQELADDEHRDLIRDGIHAYCGSRPTTSKIVSELVWCSAASPVVPSDGPGATYYAITEMGHAFLRRPELEEEYRAAVMARKGPFSSQEPKMGRARFPCPYCGAAKKTRMGLCSKCYRFGDALPEHTEPYKHGVADATKAVEQFRRDLAKIK